MEGKKQVTNHQKELAKKAESYRDEMDFAFFHVNFHTTKADYLAFTEVEKAFIRKEYESKMVSENTQSRNAFYNAYVNANRKKNSKFQDLYKKKQEKADVEFNLDAIKAITEMEEEQGKTWVDKIYKANGMKVR